jgi:hypothetical protein
MTVYGFAAMMLSCKEEAAIRQCSFVANVNADRKPWRFTDRKPWRR